MCLTGSPCPQHRPKHAAARSYFPSDAPPPRPSPPSTHSSPAKCLKAKTEMCRYFTSGIACPYGSMCLYAHGFHELRKLKVMTMVQNGAITNIDSYRTRPCMSFVSTGSCPFGNRCSGLHDPRVVGTNQTWLPHRERPLVKLDTDVFVDNLHHHHTNAISHGTPFAGLIPKDVLHPKGDKEVPDFKRRNDWEHFYEQICSGIDDKVNAAREGSMGKEQRPPSTLTERHRLEIVLKMRGGPMVDRHKYTPSHHLMQETCMVLQTRAFRIDGKSVREIPLESSDEARGRGIETVVVREVAFGSDADPSVRGVALWFGLPSSAVVLNTPGNFNATRSALARAPANMKATVHECITSTADARSAKVRTSKNKMSAIDEYLSTTGDIPFYLVRPRDEDAFDLSTQILIHRLKTLRSADIKTPQVQRREFASLDAEEKKLRATFESLCHHWASCAWGMTTNHPLKVDEHTILSEADEEYQTEPTYASSVRGCSSKMTPKFWDSFVRDMSGKPSSFKANRTRLATFEVLAEGISMPPGRSLIPRIKNQCLISHQPGWDAAYQHFSNNLQKVTSSKRI